MDRLTPVCLAAAMLALAACTGPLVHTAVPATLKPEGQRLSERVGERGVQIYEWRALPNAAGASWVQRGHVRVAEAGRSRPRYW